MHRVAYFGKWNIPTYTLTVIRFFPKSIKAVKMMQITSIAPLTNLLKKRQKLVVAPTQDVKNHSIMSKKTGPKGSLD